MKLVGKSEGNPGTIDLNKLGVNSVRPSGGSNVGRYSHVRDTELNLVERTRRQGAKAPSLSIRGGSQVFTKIQYSTIEDVVPEFQKLAKCRNHEFDLEIVGVSWGTWLVERVDSDIQMEWSTDQEDYVPVTWQYTMMLIESIGDGSSSVSL